MLHRPRLRQEGADVPSEVEPEDAVHVVAELPGEVSPEEERPIDPWGWLERGETMMKRW